MKKLLRRLILGLVVLGGLVYVGLVLQNLGNEFPVPTQDMAVSRHKTVAVFGATGTIGDGLLKAVMADAAVDSVHVVTRRTSPRMDSGVAEGRVQVATHSDYQNYSAISNILSNVDAIYWAIGLSAVGLDEATYREIHATYPLKLITEWLKVSERDQISFHYVSGAGAKAGSRMMWAREKARAEAELARLANGTKLRVASYRPALILPTESEANFGHRILHAIFVPVGFSVKAESIGQAMLEVSGRGEQLGNGVVLENTDILKLSRAYEKRRDFGG